MVATAQGTELTTPKRALSFPELPTVEESGVAGYSVTSWNGMLAPAATPAAIIQRLNGTLEKTENWGRRKLAYEIGRHKEGTYVLELIIGSVSRRATWWQRTSST